MDDLNQLRFRNGELTAEVRMLTSQLAEAKNAGSHLLNHFNVQGNDHSKYTARLERLNKKAVRENRQLRAHIGLTQKRATLSPFASKKAALRLKNKRDSLTTTVTEHSADDITENEYESRSAANTKKLPLEKTPTSIVDSVDSLISLSDHEVLKPTTVAKKKVVEPVPKVKRSKEIARGLANLRTPRPVWEQDQYTSIGEGGLQQPFRPKAQLVNDYDYDFDVVLHDGCDLHVPMPSYSERHRDGATPHIPKPFDQNTYKSRFIPGGNVFTDTEHNQLSGNAVYLEDMRQHQLTEFWNRRSRTHPNHTALEWRQYYENNIRPAYLRRLRTAPSGDVIASDTSPDITPAAAKPNKSFDTQTNALVRPEPALITEGINAIEDVEAAKAVNNVECIKAEEHLDAVKDNEDVETIEKVEEVTPIAVNIVHYEQPSFTPAGIASAAIPEGGDDPTSEHSYCRALPESSNTATPATVPHAEARHTISTETARTKKEELTVKLVQPYQVSTANKESKSVLEPLPGLPKLPPHTGERIPSAFHQIVTGQHPSQLTSSGQRADARSSRFFNLHEISSKQRDIPRDEMEPRDESHQTRGGHSSRPGRLGPHSQSKFRSNISPDHGSSHPSHGPGTVEDLFAKPKNFHDDPLAFRSVAITVPPSINLVTALSRVRIDGGTLYSATYIETSKMNTTPPSPDNHVILAFLSGAVAREFVKQSGADVIFHVCDETKTVVFTEATLICTATRPIPHHIQRNIVENKLTRILWIQPPDGGNARVPLTVQEIWRFLVHGGNGEVKVPLHASKDDSGVIRLEYASMSDAKAAWDVIKGNEQYFTPTTYGFMPDSCSSNVTLRELQTWHVELSAHIASGLEEDQELGVVAGDGEEEEEEEEQEAFKSASVEVQFARVYDFAANAERELQIKELRAAKYLEDLALGRGGAGARSPSRARETS